MLMLIIEENMCAECLKDVDLWNSAKKECLINCDAPGAQGFYHAFVSRCVARRHNSKPNGRLLLSPSSLQSSVMSAEPVSTDVVTPLVRQKLMVVTGI